MLKSDIERTLQEFIPHSASYCIPDLTRVLLELVEIDKKGEEQMLSEFAKQQAAQAWCTETTKNKVMDVELCEAFAKIIEKLTSQSWLGNASTRELLNEISARVDLNYKTTE